VDFKEELEASSVLIAAFNAVFPVLRITLPPS
jgi:hypothetical protein